MNDFSNLTKHGESSLEPVRQGETVAPPVDVYENANELLLFADVPGATHDGVDVQLDKGQLTIYARRQAGEEGSPIGLEYRPRDYARTFSVPQGIDATKIEAQLSGGVLRLRLPKSDSLKPRRIEVVQR